MIFNIFFIFFEKIFIKKTTFFLSIFKKFVIFSLFINLSQGRCFDSKNYYCFVRLMQAREEAKNWCLCSGLRWLPKTRLKATKQIKDCWCS